ncbi:MAG: amidohydrolase family protein [Desulfobacterota bacterium]|jgi:cytosine/adenosine deaminase-related metal-dependent hydrolase|nr:amidohydrolase family protein [Thermodesulfobacteriota bacterium]
MEAKPFLLNAHTQLELAGLSHLCPSEPVPFTSWVGRMSWNRFRLIPTRIHFGVLQGIRELKKSGTTHVWDITATGASVTPLLGSGLEGIIFLEVRGLGIKKARSRLRLVQEHIRFIRQRHRGRRFEAGLFLHAPYSCHPDLLREGAVWSLREGIPLGIRVAESPAETELLTSGQIASISPLYRCMARLKRAWPDHIPGQRPIPFLDSLGVLDARPILVHAVDLTDDEIDLIARKGCSVVHCPRSNERLSCGRMPLEKFLQAGVPVRLGTGTPTSIPDLDIRNEAAFAQALHRGWVDSKVIEGLIRKNI